MRIIPLAAAFAFAASAGALVASHPALAAHAGAPYANVDRSNDAGNDTGDAKVDALNAAQLNSNYWQAARQPGAVPNPPHPPVVIPPNGAAMQPMATQPMPMRR